jgi:hypothetical protein
MRHKEGVSYQISNNFIIFCNQLTPSIVNIFFTKTTFTGHLIRQITLFNVALSGHTNRN